MVYNLRISFKACSLPPNSQLSSVGSLESCCVHAWPPLPTTRRVGTIILIYSLAYTQRMSVEWISNGTKMSLRCSDAGALPAPFRAPDLPHVAQAGGSEGLEGRSENTLLLPGINTSWSLGLTVLTLPFLLSCSCRTRSPFCCLSNSWCSLFWVTFCIYCCIWGKL